MWIQGVIPAYPVWGVETAPGSATASNPVVPGPPAPLPLPIATRESPLNLR
jgi:hypothetical protein